MSSPWSRAEAGTLRSEAAPHAAALASSISSPLVHVIPDLQAATLGCSAGRLQSPARSFGCGIKTLAPASISLAAEASKTSLNSSPSTGTMPAQLLSSPGRPPSCSAEVPHFLAAGMADRQTDTRAPQRSPHSSGPTDGAAPRPWCTLLRGAAVLTLLRAAARSLWRAADPAYVGSTLSPAGDVG